MHPLIHAFGLKPEIKAKIAGFFYFDVIDSTNEFLLKQNAHRDFFEDRWPVGEKTDLRPGFLICIANEQTAGRGRFGRSWYSPPGLNIYLSLSHWSDAPAWQTQDLSMKVGSIIIDLLEEWGVQDLSLKWPNDVYLAQKKLAGILVETQGNYTVLGIGMNNGSNDPQAPIDQPWTDLGAYQFDKKKIMAELINRLLFNLFLESNHQSSSLSV